MNTIGGKIERQTGKDLDHNTFMKVSFSDQNLLKTLSNCHDAAAKKTIISQKF